MYFTDSTARHKDKRVGTKEESLKTEKRRIQIQIRCMTKERIGVLLEDKTDKIVLTDLRN